MCVNFVHATNAANHCAMPPTNNVKTKAKHIFSRFCVITDYRKTTELVFDRKIFKSFIASAF